MKYIYKVFGLILFLTLSFFIIINNINQRAIIQNELIKKTDQINSETAEQAEITARILSENQEKLRKGVQEGKIKKINPQEIEKIPE
jgi:hypothetical protein